MAEMNIYEGAIDKGLEGVVACSTSISSIQGATLTYRGYTIEDLAREASFEESIYLLWKGQLPTSKELTAFSSHLANDMALDPAFVALLKNMVSVFPKTAHPMDFLRTAVSVSSFFDRDSSDQTEVAFWRKASRMTAKMGTIVAAFHRLRMGLEVVAPVANKSLAWNFLNMLFGRPPSAQHERVFNTALVLHADHEINCSAFSARVTTSSLSDIYSAVVSAIGTLKGPLHGGANEQVMKMLEEIGSLENVQPFLDKALAGKQKIMGIGHRVYKNGDPRAKILREMSKELTQSIGRPELYEMSTKIDDTMQQKKGLMPNVDFYSATVYFSMDIPIDLYTPIFAVSRIAGWVAHIAEQNLNNRIYRPRGAYVGAASQDWKPLQSRV